MQRTLSYIHGLLCGDFGPMPRYDKTFGDDQAASMRHTLHNGAWQEADAFISRLTDHNDRAFYLDLAADWPGRPGWLEQWASTKPALGLLVRGIHSVHWAWQARGMGWVPLNTGDFRRRLELARLDLERAAQMLPADPAPWAWLIRVQRGQQEPVDIALERFKQARKRCDDHWDAHRSLLESLCSKWGGSEAMMWNFVEKATSRALHGSPIHALVPFAMFEDCFAQQRTNPRMSDNDYYFRPDRQQRLHLAATHWQRSPAFKTLRVEPALRNMFAVVMYASHMYSDSYEEFKAIGPYMGFLPWGGDSPKAIKDFLAMRRSAKRRSTWTRLPDGRPVNQVGLGPA